MEHAEADARLLHEDELVAPLGGGGAGEDATGVQLSHSERLHMQRVRELDSEELEVEEVGSDLEADRSDDSSLEGRGDGGAGPRGRLTFHTELSCLVSRHTYLGDVDDVTGGCGRQYNDGGALLTLPMFFLEGIVLFPEDTLPLRVLQPRLKAAVYHALHQTIAPSTLGVVHVGRNHDGGGRLASVGTTAEIRKVRSFSDGSMNVITRGRQRFTVGKTWTDVEGTPYAEVRIIEEDKVLHIPREAFGRLACVPNYESGKVVRAQSTVSDDVDSDKGEMDDGDSHVTMQAEDPRSVGTRSVDSKSLSDGEDESSEEESDDNRRLLRMVLASDVLEEVGPGQLRNEQEDESSDLYCDAREAKQRKRGRYEGWGGACKAWAADEIRWRRRAQLSAWPHWVYRMYDAYDLARRATDMWRQMIDQPLMCDANRSPEMVSYYIASNLPVQDSTKQELLETNGVAYRLKMEIQILETLERLCCKSCGAVIAKRSDMLVMSAEGPVSAFVNEHGYIFEALTLTRARGLVLDGRPETAHSWFPGYSWTIAHCVHCELHMGWYFRAVKEGSQPKAFWGIRRSQLAEERSAAEFRVRRPNSSTFGRY